MSPDLVNGLFEFAVAGFILNHCRVLYRDKRVGGVSIVSTVFFTAWGVWNLYYYPALAQYWSFAGGCAIVAANALWIAMMVHYRRRAARDLAAWYSLLLEKSTWVPGALTDQFAAICRPRDYIDPRKDDPVPFDDAAHRRKRGRMRRLSERTGGTGA